MARRPRPAALLAAAAFVLAPVPAARAAPPCAPRADAEVRLDDGRMLVERAEHAVDPRNVRERWWACWRPTGRRTLLQSRVHPRDVGETALLTVRRGRFLVLAGGDRLDVHDARAGRRTATMPQRGAVRQLVVTAKGRLAALQDDGHDARVLLGGGAARSCVLDAGRPAEADGSAFGDLTADGERVRWFHNGVALASDVAPRGCRPAS